MLNLFLAALFLLIAYSQRPNRSLFSFVVGLVFVIRVSSFF